MRLLAGTSGFNYKEWKGPFYPDDLPANQMLRYYGEHLSTVEINNTFYRMPKREVVERWAAEVPDGFTFVLKASRRITHQARLVETEETVEYLWRNATELGDKLGPILFQLPPFLRADVPRMQAFLGSLPEGMRAVVEVRHDSWREQGFYTALRERGAALCIADSEEVPEPAIVPTGSFGYFRLRRDTYSDDELRVWADRIRAQPWDECFVFFKHEDGGAAPRAAARFLEVFG